MIQECEYRIYEDGKPLCQNKMGFDFHDYDCENCVGEDLE